MRQIAKKIYSILAILIVLFSPIRGYGAEEHVEYISFNSIIKHARPGYSDKNTTVTRDEFTAWIMQIINKIRDDDYKYQSYNDENKSELLRQAVEERILPEYSSSDSSDFIKDIEKNITREEACYIIQKAFCTNVNSSKNLLYQYDDNGDVSKWAWDSFSDIVSIIQKTESNYLIKKKLSPKQTVLESDVINILEPVMSAQREEIMKKYRPQEEKHGFSWVKLFSFIWYIINSVGIFLSAVISCFTIVLVVVVYFYTHKKIIYIGAKNAGKKNLRKCLPIARRAATEKVIHSNPKRAIKKPIVFKDSRGEMKFKGKTIDIPDEQDGGLKKLNRALSWVLFKNRIIIVLVLAHTDLSNKSDQKHAYIEEQLSWLTEYLQIIKNKTRNIDRILVFINKYDLLESYYEAGEYGIEADKEKEIIKNIYREHIGAIRKELGACIDIKIGCKVGSAARAINIPKLKQMFYDTQCEGDEWSVINDTYFENA